MPIRPGISIFVCFLALLYGGFRPSRTVIAAGGKVTRGALQIVDAQGKPAGDCPLRRTDVRAEISGFLARVTVTQEFVNTSGPSEEAVEAVYLFPLPVRSAVDRMTMEIGGRIIRGEIRRRAEAQRLFAEARAEGRVAALLEQERPNLFTQSVTNLAPGATVRVTISYVETLAYEDGVYEFVFPMVAGPRYLPAEGVADAERLAPPRVPDGMRPGHDISIEVALDAGVPIEQLAAELHEVEIDREGNHQAIVRLKDKETIPDRDFILRYGVAGMRIADGLLAHRDERGGYFTLLLQPPARPAVEDVAPKELVFVLDTSGSMSGLPLETAKRVMRMAFEGLYEHDTFNLITFAGETQVLFEKPVPATRANLKRALDLIEGKRGGGGTEMMKAIRAALADSDAQDHVRIVCFLTDGEVGNDLAIIHEVKQHPKARVFSFGIGNSVNRFLLDKIAEHGRGEASYVLLNRGAESDAQAAAEAARRFHERVRAPLLMDLSIDWNGLPVADLYPKRLPDLFSAKPIAVTGRFTGGARGALRLRGKRAGQDFEREIFVEFPEVEPRHEALASFWARARIDDLMAIDLGSLQAGTTPGDAAEAITQLGLDYRLMTQFTSFIAIGDVVTAPGEAPRREMVPVAAPNGATTGLISGVSETVTITSSTATIDADVMIGSTVEQRSLDSLPLNMRQPAELAKLAAGAAPT